MGGRRRARDRRVRGGSCLSRPSADVFEQGDQGGRRDAGDAGSLAQAGGLMGFQFLPDFVGKTADGGVIEVGRQVQGLVAALMSDTPATWQEAGYEGLADFVSKHPVADELLSNAEQVLQEYDNFEASPSAVKPYDMLPREQILARMRSDYQELVDSFAQACALEAI